MRCKGVARLPLIYTTTSFDFNLTLKSLSIPQLTDWLGSVLAGNPESTMGNMTMWCCNNVMMLRNAAFAKLFHGPATEAVRSQLLRCQVITSVLSR